MPAVSLTPRSMASTTNDIPVTINGNALQPGMTVLIFGAKYAFVTHNEIQVAWKTFPSGNTCAFTYPKATFVGGYYCTGARYSTVSIPRQLADRGTTWNYITSSQHPDGMFVQQSKSVM